MTYETKDSGERAEFESGMQRDTQTGKPRFDLTQPKGIPFDEQLLTRFALLMGRGAEKYTERNWEQASGQEELDRFLASAFRHFMQWYAGERDEDHAAAVMFNMMGFETTLYKMQQAAHLEENQYVAERLEDLADSWVKDWDKAHPRPVDDYTITFKVNPSPSRFDQMVKDSFIGYFTQGRLRD